MVLTKFTYYDGKKKKTLLVKNVSVFSTGLLFKRKSPPLLFELNKEKTFSIFSYFCPQFKAIWLDKNKKITKITEIKEWKFRITGYGKYLIEIPLLKKSQNPSKNRNI